MSRATVRDRNDWQAAEAWKASRDYIPEPPAWEPGDDRSDNWDEDEVIYVAKDVSGGSAFWPNTFPAEQGGSLDGGEDRDCPPDSEDRR
jgi:hypothetical protein